MRRALDETQRRRTKQIAFNAARGITPRGVSKRIKDIIDGVYDPRAAHKGLKAAQTQAGYGVMSEVDLSKEIRRLEKEMLEHARNLEFEQAAQIRDRLRGLKEKLFGVATGELPDASSEAQRAEPEPRRTGGAR
jgi:excinuclease ABC subunit B